MRWFLIALALFFSTPAVAQPAHNGWMIVVTIQQAKGNTTATWTKQSWPSAKECEAAMQDDEAFNDALEEFLASEGPNESVVIGCFQVPEH